MSSECGLEDGRSRMADDVRDRQAVGGRTVDDATPPAPPYERGEMRNVESKRVRNDEGQASRAVMTKILESMRENGIYGEILGEQHRFQSGPRWNLWTLRRNLWDG